METQRSNNLITPSFITERLVLRQINLKDSDSYQKNFNDYEVIKQLSHKVPWPFPSDGAYNHIKEQILPSIGNSKWYWGICQKVDIREVIGSIGVWKKPSPANRGFWLAKRYWNKGYMSEALFPIMNFAFNSLGFDAFVLCNAKGNLKSSKIKAKMGARFVGLEDGKYVNSLYTQREIWNLTKQDWDKYCKKSS